MKHSVILVALFVGIFFLLPSTSSWARGFGGGMRGGGLGGGGGIRGGNLGGAGIGDRSAGFGNFGGGGALANRSPGGAGLGNLGAGSGFGDRGLGSSGFNGGDRLSGLGSQSLGEGGRSGAIGSGNRGLGGDGLNGLRNGANLGGNALGGGVSRDSFGDRFSGQAPSKSQLSSFLGLPSDGGMNHLSSTNINSQNRTTNINANFNGDLGEGLGDNFDVNRGSAEGPRGGQAGGISVTGPQGNTAYRGGVQGADGGVAGFRGVQGADGGGAIQGAARGPAGNIAAGGAVRGPDGGTAARGVAAGPRGVAGGSAIRGPDGGFATRGIAAGPGGVAAGFARVSPSGRYQSAVAVRSNFNDWGIYHAGWYTDHPGAWFAAGWAANTAWRAATWGAVGSWMSYYPAEPVYYDYGSTVTYQDNNVYVNGQDVGTSQQYYDEASNLASSGAKAEAPSDGDWMPLGVFALTQSGQSKSNVTLQLAINKEGIIRGNYTDTATGKTQIIQGSVDKKTQRVAFTVGDDTKNVVETGLYNLTKDEAPVLIHFGADKTEQWLLVRLKSSDSQSN